MCISENNTIYGTKFKKLPNTKGKTLVADVSSCFLSEPVDVTKYGVIYGGVRRISDLQGVVIVIIREDLITEDVLPGTPDHASVQDSCRCRFSLQHTTGIWYLYLRQSI